jgi:glycine/D-amino acid oxidase-like deaminating enzyme
VDTRVVSQLVERASWFLPGIDRVPPERVWTGFRPATPDSLPLIGPHPRHPGLYIAAGHEGLGITTGLATGQIIADLIAGRQPAIPLGPFDPVRPARWN